jgi:transposase
LNIPRSTIKSIIKTWKECGTTTNLPREGRPPKLTDQARRALIREATVTKDNPEGAAKLHGRDPRQRSVQRTTLSRSRHRASLYGKVARKKPLLKEKNKQTRLVFAKRHVGDSLQI